MIKAKHAVVHHVAEDGDIAPDVQDAFVDQGVVVRRSPRLGAVAPTGAHRQPAVAERDGFRRPAVGVGERVRRDDEAIQHDPGGDHPDLEGVRAGGAEGVGSRKLDRAAQDGPAPEVAAAGSAAHVHDLRGLVVEGNGVAETLGRRDRQGRNRHGRDGDRAGLP